MNIQHQPNDVRTSAKCKNSKRKPQFHHLSKTALPTSDLQTGAKLAILAIFPPRLVQHVVWPVCSFTPTSVPFTRVVSMVAGRRLLLWCFAGFVCPSAPSQHQDIVRRSEGGFVRSSGSSRSAGRTRGAKLHETTVRRSVGAHHAANTARRPAARTGAWGTPGGSARCEGKSAEQQRVGDVVPSSRSASHEVGRVMPQDDGEQPVSFANLLRASGTAPCCSPWRAARRSATRTAP